MAFLAPMVPWLSAGAAAASGISSFMGMRQGNAASMENQRLQIAIANRNRAIMETNAKTAERDLAIAERASGDTALSGQEAAQQQDFAAAAEIGQEVARTGASGLRGHQGANTLRRLAGMDRRNISRARDADVMDARSRVSSIEGQITDFNLAAAGYADDAVAARVRGEAERRDNTIRGWGGVASSIIGLAQNPMLRNWADRRGQKPRVGPVNFQSIY